MVGNQFNFSGINDLNWLQINKKNYFSIMIARKRKLGYASFTNYLAAHQQEEP